ncbi:hypothetical protein [Leptolyngbya iicbica]|uniref:hypothetical protein n=1 Tax=Leptolyngbya iicbica TaxID=3161580 RepID=UPI001269C50E|nr:hypothetical protein [Leptolyngbya sp. LK]
MQLSASEWQCLRWLQQHASHNHEALAVPLPLPQLSTVRRDRLWQQLKAKGLVDFDVVVTRFGLSATGRMLLQLDRSVLPVTPDEKWVLRSCRDRSIHPDQIAYKVPHDQRQALIAGLAEQGLLRITRQQIGKIWLTPAGAAVLRYDCAP